MLSRDTARPPLPLASHAASQPPSCGPMGSVPPPIHRHCVQAASGSAAVNRESTPPLPPPPSHPHPPPSSRSQRSAKHSRRQPLRCGSARRAKDSTRTRRMQIFLKVKSFNVIAVNFTKCLDSQILAERNVSLGAHLRHKILHLNVQWFRGGLVLKAQR